MAVALPECRAKESMKTQNDNIPLGKLVEAAAKECGYENKTAHADALRLTDTAIGKFYNKRGAISPSRARTLAKQLNRAPDDWESRATKEKDDKRFDNYMESQAFREHIAHYGYAKQEIHDQQPHYTLDQLPVDGGIDKFTTDNPTGSRIEAAILVCENHTPANGMQCLVKIANQWQVRNYDCELMHERIAYKIIDTQ